MRIYGMVGCRPINTYCGDKIKRYDGDRFVLRSACLFSNCHKKTADSSSSLTER